MELILIGMVPVLFMVLGIVIIMVSQVSSYFTFNRYSSRQRADNRVITGFISGLQTAQTQLASRSRQLSQLTQSLATSNQELERLNSMKTKFLSMAVHDVRTPLGTIRGYAQLLSAQALDKKKRGSVDGIVMASEQIGRLLGDLTDLAVIEAGKLRMDKALFDSSGLVQELMSTFMPLAAQRGIHLSAIESAPGASIVGDRFRIGQVLSNFIGNALKFTPQGGRVELRVTAASDGMFFSVTDSGPGIHPDERKRIFEKFYQSKFSDPKVGRKGWGLGLSIAQEIVQAHKGDIGVESAGLGKGSKFWFYIPANPPQRSGFSVRAPRYLMAVGCAMIALLLPPLAAPARAQMSIPIEDKAKYDKFLEEKAETVLLKILGPNRSKIIVDATLDFTRTEKFQITTGGTQNKDQAYAWQQVTSQGGGSMKELLPGIPITGDSGVPQFYERSYGYPTAFVKKLIVTIVVDKSVTPEQSDSIQSIVSDLLEIDPNRGDILTVVKATFAPAWKTMWYSQDQFSMIVRYGVISLMTLITLIVLAACFIRLTGAMDTMARAQAQQYAMDVGVRGGEGGPMGIGGPGGLPGLPAPESREGQPPPDEKSAQVIINVRPEQIPILVDMLKSEDPDNIALVMAYLDPEVRRAFLKEMPRGIEAEIIVRMADVRFVEPEMVEKIKEEIERRLEGSVGGMSRVYDIIQAAPPEIQRELLKELEAKNPEMAKLVRSRVLLMEDLVRLRAGDWTLLVGKVKIEDWAAGLHDATADLKAAVKKHVLPKTWMILEQTMESIPASPRKIAESQAVILRELQQLITDGLVPNPLAQPKPELPAPAQPAPAAAAPAPRRPA